MPHDPIPPAHHHRHREKERRDRLERNRRERSHLDLMRPFRDAEELRELEEDRRHA